MILFLPKKGKNYSVTLWLTLFQPQTAEWFVSWHWVFGRKRNQSRVMAMNSKLLMLTAAALAIASVLFSFDLKALFAPIPIPGSKDTLHTAQTFQVTGAFGPESLAFDSNGEGPYTGVADGRILKWEGEARGWTDFAVTTSNRYQLQLLHRHCRPFFLYFKSWLVISICEAQVSFPFRLLKKFQWLYFSSETSILVHNICAFF